MKRTAQHAMTGGLFIFTLIIAGQFIGVLSISPSDSLNVPGFTPDGMKGSAGLFATTLTGSNQMVRYVASSPASISNTAATSNLTIPAISSDSSLIAANGTFQFNEASFDTNHTIENSSGYNFPYQNSGDWKEPENVSTSSIIVGTENGTYPFTNLND
ncbi:MAG: hypothetical protein ACTSUE_21885, partial [Promethearchaeota archaeon]